MLQRNLEDTILTRKGPPLRCGINDTRVDKDPPRPRHLRPSLPFHGEQLGPQKPHD